MNQQFVPINSVFASLIRSGRTLFNEDDVVEWCAEALELIGAVRAYEEAVAFIEVKNHQCKLPLGLHKIIQVAKNNGNYKNCTPLDICQAAQSCTPQGTPCASLDSDAVWLDCNGSPIVSYDVAYYRPYFDLKTEHAGWSNSSYYRQNFTPIRLANHTLFNTLVSEEGSGYNSNGADEYTIILGSILRTSFKEGQVCLSFYRQVRDPKTGYPMIPDEQSYKTAINKYLLLQLANVDFENGREGAAQRVSKYEDDWQWYCSQSADKAMMPSGIDEYQNLLDQRTKLIPNYNSYYKFFGNLSKPEVGYPLTHNSDIGGIHLPSCKKDKTCTCPVAEVNPTIIYSGSLPIVTVPGNQLEIYNTVVDNVNVTYYRWTNLLYNNLRIEVFLNSINRFLNSSEYVVYPEGIVEIVVGGPYTPDDIFKIIPNG